MENNRTIHRRALVVSLVSSVGVSGGADAVTSTYAVHMSGDDRFELYGFDHSRFVFVNQSMGVSNANYAVDSGGLGRKLLMLDRRKQNGEPSLWKVCDLDGKVERQVEIPGSGAFGETRMSPSATNAAFFDLTSPRLDRRRLWYGSLVRSDWKYTIIPPLPRELSESVGLSPAGEDIFACWGNEIYEIRAPGVKKILGGSEMGISPDGKWMSYIDLSGKVRLLEMASGKEILPPIQSRGRVEWLPDSSGFVYVAQGSVPFLLGLTLRRLMVWRWNDEVSHEIGLVGPQGMFLLRMLVLTPRERDKLGEVKFG